MIELRNGHSITSLRETNTVLHGTFQRIARCHRNRLRITRTFCSFKLILFVFAQIGRYTILVDLSAQFLWKAV